MGVGVGVVWVCLWVGVGVHIHVSQSFSLSVCLGTNFLIPLSLCRPIFFSIYTICDACGGVNDVCVNVCVCVCVCVCVHVCVLHVCVACMYVCV